MSEVLDRPTTAPVTRIPPGNWRIIVWIPAGTPVNADVGCIKLEEDLWAGLPLPSREVAEEHARKFEADPSYRLLKMLGVCELRGVRFFPAAA